VLGVLGCWGAVATACRMTSMIAYGLSAFALHERNGPRCQMLERNNIFSILLSFRQIAQNQLKFCQNAYGT